MQWLIYLFFRAMIFVAAKLPFAAIYKIADVLAVVLEKIVRYRSKVTLTNLKNAFPEKSPAEISSILHAFYRHLADLIMETIKGYSVSPQVLMPRYRFKSLKKLENYVAEGRSVVFVGGHYGNWEWGVMCGALQLPHYIVCYYKPIKNPYIDRFYRQQFSTDRNLVTVPKNDAVRSFVKYRKQTVGHLLIADQSPLSGKNATWLPFLNQDTACLNGPEKLATRFDYPVFFVQIERVKRGHYEVELTEITATPQQMAAGEITAAFFERLERQIINNPPFWLWSHKRWKKKRVED